MDLYDEEIPLIQEEIERLREKDKLNREAEFLNLANLVLDLKGGNRRKMRQGIEQRIKEISENG